MALQPVYSSDHLTAPAFHLRYSWTGWPSQGVFPEQPDPGFFAQLNDALAIDGIRILEKNSTADRIQLTCSVKPTVNPVTFVGRIKGRLQHSLRQSGLPLRFSRKVSFRSIGENKREEVEGYIAKQVEKERFIDDRFAELMREFTITDSSVRLQQPTSSNSGRYWYTLHLVLVTAERLRFNDRDSLRKIASMCHKVATKKSYRIRSQSVMPDHLHLALAGNIEQAPEEIALAFMNNIAYAFKQNPIFRPSYYVGTFGEYDMGAVRC